MDIMKMAYLNERLQLSLERVYIAGDKGNGDNGYLFIGYKLVPSSHKLVYEPI